MAARTPTQLYLLIAGTYTPFGLLVMSAEWAVPVLSVAWAGALAAILMKLFWARMLKRLSAARSPRTSDFHVLAAKRPVCVPVALAELQHALIRAPGLAGSSRPY
jgi:hypothetical protein